MEFKGTPGPWFISFIDIEPLEEWLNSGCHSISNFNNTTGDLAQCWFGENQIARTQEEAHYNAKLISKAPEMLNMLKDILDPSVRVTSEDITTLIKEATTI